MRPNALQANITPEPTIARQALRDRLAQRLDGIRRTLMCHHGAGSPLPNAAKGAERETVVRDFLSKVFPAPFRFGRGAVIDGAGSVSGQLDIVVEFPFFPSFPTPGGEERLYLAESVAFAIEVKSDLSAQWGQVEQAAERFRRLRRSWSSQMTFSHGVETLSAAVGGGAITSPIPFVALGFVGYDTVESLDRRLRATPEEMRPDAALVIETGAYVGLDTDARGIGAAGLFAFCTEAAALVISVLSACPDFQGYFATP